MAAAATPVAPGNGRLGRLRAPRVGLRVCAAAAAGAGEGPSCLYVGPIETASQEMLEALYRQARDSYYSGQPLIVDDMFDKVELKLRVYGSPSVVKFPRCSLKRQSAYADAEEDHSRFMALSSIWTLLLLFGTSAFLVPSFYTLSLAFGDAFGARSLFSGAKSLDGITRVNHMVLIGLGYLIGYPVASASAVGSAPEDTREYPAEEQYSATTFSDAGATGDAAEYDYTADDPSLSVEQPDVGAQESDATADGYDYPGGAYYYVEDADDQE